MKGTVKFFNETKGFGFIAGEDGKEAFVHKTSIENNAILHENDTVTFDVEQGDRGLKAIHVKKEAKRSVKEEATTDDEEDTAEDNPEEQEE